MRLEQICKLYILPLRPYLRFEKTYSPMISNNNNNNNIIYKTFAQTK
jgi:hypothetical protein